MDLLDHSDHQKSGRALILVSVSFILLDQCSVTFSDATILGIKIYLEKEHLQKLFIVLAILFFALFIVRLWMTGGWDRFYAYQAVRTKQRNEALEAYGAVSGFGPVAFQRNGTPYFPGHNRGTGEAQQTVARYISKYTRLAIMDVTVFFATEVLPPVLFFSLAFFSRELALYNLVCPGSPLGWPLP